MRSGAAALLAAACIAGAGLHLIAQTPPGKTVWSGVYSDAQAVRGQTEYAAHCTSCHKDDLSGYQNVLKGDRFMEQYREAPVYRLFDKIKTTMPRNAVGSLSDHQYLDIVTFILQFNEFPAGGQELTAADLPEVLVVGKGGAEPVPDYSLVQVIGCLSHNEKDDTWIITRATDPVRAPQPQVGVSEVTASAARPLGTATVELMVSAAHDPAPHSGHKVDARGFLIRRPAGNRVNITGIETVALDCGR